MTWEQITLAAGMLVVNLLAAVIGGTWVLGRTTQDLSEKIDEAKLELERRINDESDDAIKRFGETVSAIRQKISEMELWNRDTFVSKRTFETIVSDIRDTWRRFEDKIDRRFDSLDRKLSKRDDGGD